MNFEIDKIKFYTTVNSYVPHFKRHRKELIAGAIESSATMEAATKRSGVDRRTLSRIQSIGCQFFPSLDFFGSFFGNEKKNLLELRESAAPYQFAHPATSL